VNELYWKEQIYILKHGLVLMVIQVMIKSEILAKLMSKKILIVMDSINYQHIEERYFLLIGILLIFLMRKTKNVKFI
jgi:hypothetical protein